MLRKILLLLISIALCSAMCPDDEYCLSCNANRCAFCIYSYLNQDTGVCVPTAKIPHCTEYANETICIACAPGKNLKNNECVPITIENCKIAEMSENSVNGQFVVSETCLVCNDGILLTNGICDPNNKCAVANCLDCARDVDNNEVCVKCKEGNVLSMIDGSCVDKGIKGCLEIKDQTSTACDECLPGYYHSTGGKCLASTKYDEAEDFVESDPGVTEIDESDESEEEKSFIMGVIAIFTVILVNLR